METRPLSAGVSPPDPAAAFDRCRERAVSRRLAHRLDAATSVRLSDAGAERLCALQARSGRDLRRAALHYERAIGIAPHHAGLIHEFAQVLRDRGDLAQAIATLRQLVDSGHASIDLLVELADLQRAARAYEDAEATLSRVLMIAPGHGEAWLSQAHLLAARGHAVAADSAYARLCATMPDWSAAWLHRGLHAFHGGHLRDARAWLARSVELDAAHSGAWFALGRINAALGLSMRAVDCFDRALALNAHAELIAGARGRAEAMHAAFQGRMAGDDPGHAPVVTHAAPRHAHVPAVQPLPGGRAWAGSFRLLVPLTASVVLAAIVALLSGGTRPPVEARPAQPCAAGCSSART